METTIRKTTYRLTVNVRHWSAKKGDADCVDTVTLVSEAPLSAKKGDTDYVGTLTLTSEAPFVAIHEGERLRIAGVEGFSESRLTDTRVTEVLHTLSSERGHLMHDTTVYAVQDKGP
jgi:hypothetical protein